MMSLPKRLLFFSSMVFYPIHWDSFVSLCERYDVSGFAIPASFSEDLPSVHRQLGWVDILSAQNELPDVSIRFIPGIRRIWQVAWLWQQLRDIQPDAIWVQEEPTDFFLLAVLVYYRFKKISPVIVTAVCENIFQPIHPLKQLLRRWLWGRLDGLLAAAQASVEGIRRVGMPEHVPFRSLVAGASAPSGKVEPLPLPFERQPADFIVGFVGRIVEEKGWKVLLSAMEGLPSNFKCILAGDGGQMQELQDRISKPPLADRIFYLGIFPKEILWRFYMTADCLVLPSLTTPRWKEQFGGVLADAMAVGLPIIGSDSGSIPEVIGSAGLVTREGDPSSLADAIHRLAGDPSLQKELGVQGRLRFTTEFDIPAYADKIAAALKLDLKRS